MANRPITIDYTSRDFASIKDDMVRSIPHLNPAWTDQNESDPGFTLVELFSGVGDVLHEYIDRAASEAFLPTAVKRESIIKLLKLIGYELRGRVGAETLLEFSIGQPIGSANLIIPKQTEVQTTPDNQQDEPILFETNEKLVLYGTALTSDSGGTANLNVDSASGFREDDYIFITSDSADAIKRQITNVFFDTDIIQVDEDVPSGYNVADNAYIQVRKKSVLGTQGQSREVTLGQSNGQPDQEFVLERSDVLEGSDKIYVDDGTEEEWTELSFFAENADTDKVYVGTKDVNDHLVYRFGDGRIAKIPVNNSDIIVRFRTGLGQSGNIGAEKIDTVNDSITYQGQPIELNVTNPDPAVKGANRETKEEARENGPEDLRVNDRAILSRDFVVLTESYPGVAAAKSERSSDNFGEVVYVVLENEEQGSDTAKLLKQEIEEFLDNHSRPRVDVEDPEFIEIQIGGSIIYKNNEAEPEVREIVNQEIDDFFSIGGNITGFESNIYMSDLIERLDNLDSVHHVNLRRLTFDPLSTVIYGGSNSPWNGDAEFSYIDIFEDVPDALWEIEFISGNEFKVTRVTYDSEGCLVETTFQDTYSTNTDVTIENEVGDPQIEFLLSSGVESNEDGDIATFKTTPILDNILFEEEEFPIKGNNLLEFTSFDSFIEEN